MKRFAIALIVLALAVGLVAAVKPANLTIKNRSDAPVLFLFYEWADGVTGLNPVLIAPVDPKVNKAFDILPGEYVIESHACGVTTTYQAAIAGHFNITIPACPRWTHPPKQQVDGAFKVFEME